jgi:hypothetical protein
VRCLCQGNKERSRSTILTLLVGAGAVGAAAMGAGAVGAAAIGAGAVGDGAVGALTGAVGADALGQSARRQTNFFFDVSREEECQSR